MTQRQLVFGDFGNTFDNTIEKNIDIWDVEMENIQNCIAATEYWAEVFYPGGWSVNAIWQEQWDREHPPVDPEPDPAP